MDRQGKEQVVAKLAEMAGRTQLLILVDYRGLKVTEINQLRRNLEKSGDCDLLVAKNTLTRRAFEGTDMEKLFPHMVGPNAMLFAYEDPVGPTKALTEFAKDHQKLEIKAGVLAGNEISPEQIANLAKMPSKDELRAQLAGTLIAPIRDFASVLAAVPRSLANVLNALKQEKEKQAA